MGGGGGKKRVSRSTRAGLQFDVGRITKSLNAGNYADVIARNAPVCLAGVLQYLTTEVLQLAGNAARDEQKMRILPHHIHLGLRKDKELMQFFGTNSIADDDADPLADDTDALADDPDALSDDAHAFLDDAHDLEDEMADKIADAMADEMADKIADAMADEMADKIADAMADEMADAMADKMADAMADKIADAMADEIADAMADEIADAIADRGVLPNLHNSLMPEKTGGGNVGSTQTEARSLGKGYRSRRQNSVRLEGNPRCSHLQGRPSWGDGGGGENTSGGWLQSSDKRRARQRRRGGGVTPGGATAGEIFAAPDEGNASMENGVLTVTVPKQPR